MTTYYFPAQAWNIIKYFADITPPTCCRHRDICEIRENLPYTLCSRPCEKWGHRESHTTATRTRDNYQERLGGVVMFGLGRKYYPLCTECLEKYYP